MQISFFLVSLALYQTKAFNPPSPNGWIYLPCHPKTTPSHSIALSYGRGADIWPECNEDPVQLKDSFPDGIFPESVLEILEIPERVKPPRVRNPLMRLFATGVRQESSVDVTPTVIAALLFARGLVRPLDIIIVAAVTGYWNILQRYSQSTRMDGRTPTLPALPPQGHVPDLVLNPLGHIFTNSKLYDKWLKTSVVLSLALPIGLIVKQLIGRNFEGAGIFARPLFLLCCQAISESFARKSMVSQKPYDVCERSGSVDTPTFC